MQHVLLYFPNTVMFVSIVFLFFCLSANWWMCREYKRYFYCNLATKDTQWDYPVVPEDGATKNEGKKDTTKAEPTVATPPPDDEDAMELCTTPPPEEEVEGDEPSSPSSPTLNPPLFKRLKIDEKIGELPATSHMHGVHFSVYFKMYLHQSAFNSFRFFQVIRT